MRSFKMIAAGLLAAASGAAIAAPSTHGTADSRFGVQVSTSAKAQRTGSRKGLGADVSAAAHARNAARVHGTTGTGSTGDAATSAAGTTRFGSQVSAMARGQRTGSATRGLGTSVSSAAHARNAARLRRTDGTDDDAAETANLAATTTGSAAQGQSSFGAEVSAMARSQGDTRGIGSVVRDLPKPSETHAAHSDIAATVSQAQTARSDAAAARSDAAAARNDAASARADASAARSTAADASATGKQIAQDAKAIRDIVKANRPGKGH